MRRPHRNRQTHNHEGHKVSRRLPILPSCTFVPFVVMGFEGQNLELSL